jgi:hypothetical protein
MISLQAAKLVGVPTPGSRSFLVVAYMAGRPQSIANGVIVVGVDGIDAMA